MTTTQHPIRRDQTVAELATTLPGASRVFHRHGLDFCCGGHRSLGEACAAAALDPQALIAELEAEELAGESGAGERWDELPLGLVIDGILRRYHDPHRLELARLVAMARKVEDVHAAKATCPHGLAAHVERMREEMEMHMQKEERVLFPLIKSGRGRMAAMPIQVMEEEHRDHAKNLERLRELTNGYTPPAEACGTWQALYLGLSELERALMEHMHIENNILFPQALRS